MPSPDPSAGTAFRVRAVRAAGEDAVFRRVDVDVVDRRAVDVAPVDVAATVGLAAAGVVAAGLAAVDFAAAGFARALDRAGDAARDEPGVVTDRAPVAGWSSLIWAVSRATSARALDACFFRFASTSRAFRRRFSSRPNSFAPSLAALLASATPADCPLPDFATNSPSLPPYARTVRA